MPDDLSSMLAGAKQQKHCGVLVVHLERQFGELEKLYNNESTRDAAFILAKDWIEHGSPMRKAAAAQWARDKGVNAEDDQPDPNATQPEPSALSNGQDAPPSGATASSPNAHQGSAPDTQAAAGQEQPHGEAPKSHGKPGPHKPLGNKTAERLRALKAARAAQKGHRPTHTDAAAAAYDQGYRDATKRHADHAHRVSQVSARHAFALGAKAAATRAAQDAQTSGGVPQEAVPVQTNMTQQPVQKGALVGLLAKAAVAGNYGARHDAGYADPGLQADKMPRYPLKEDGKLNAERVKAAWDYINQSKNAAKYSAAGLAQVKRRIIDAYKALNGTAPPSAPARLAGAR